MTLTVTKSNATVPNIPNDSDPGTNNYLYSVYQNVAFSIDLTFTLTEVSGDPENLITTTVPITSINSSLSTYNSVSFTVIDNNPSAYKIRVSGTLTDVITGDYYTLLLKDNTLVNVPTSNLPDYLAIVAWYLPGNREVLVSSYSFNINNGYEVFNMNQYVYWDFDNALVAFRQVIAGGI